MTNINSFTLIIPAYNEEQRLPKTLARVSNWSKKVDFDIEVLVLDDGSTDKTCDIVKSFSRKNKRIKLVRSQQNLGKMLQVLKGFRMAKKEVVGVMDADLAADPAEFDKLFNNIDKADIVIGSRYLRDNLPPITGKPLVARILSRGFTILFRLFFRVPVYDPQIGFKIYKKDVIKSLTPLIERVDGFADTEIIVKAFACGYKIKEVPINYHHVSAHSKINRIQAVIPSVLALISCWSNCYHLYRQKKLVLQPANGEILLKLLYPKS